MAIFNFDFKTSRLLRERLALEEEARVREEERQRALNIRRAQDTGRIIDETFSAQDRPRVGAQEEVGALEPLKDLNQLSQQQQIKLLTELGGVGNTVAQTNSLLEPFKDERELLQAESVANQQSIRNRNAAELIATAKQDKVIEDRTQSLRKERKAVIQPFLDTVDKVGQGIASLESATGIGDLVGVVSILKAIDPRSVAREGEVDAVAKAAGLIEGVQGMINNIIGVGRLSEDARVELADQLNNLLGRAANNAEGVDRTFGLEGDKAGIKRGRLRLSDNRFDKENKIIRPKLSSKLLGVKDVTTGDDIVEGLLEKYK